MGEKISPQLIIDADWTDSGWEVSVRVSAESMELAWCDLTDEGLAQKIGPDVARLLIEDRDQK